MSNSLLSKLILPGDPVFSTTIGTLPPSWQESHQQNTIYCSQKGGLIVPMDLNSEAFQNYLDYEAEDRMEESDEWDLLEDMIPSPEAIETLARELFPHEYQ